MAAKEITTRIVLPQQVVPATDADTQRGSARREFIEALMFTMLGFAIGLAVGAMVCNQIHKGAQS